MNQAANVPKSVLVDDKTYNIISVRNGGMGRVWLLEQAFDETFDPIYRRRIAVKTFDFVEDDRAVEKELNIWISLIHPSILPLKKIGRLNYRLAAIMPLLEGSLDDVLEERGALSEGEVSRILLSVTEGLSYAWKSFGILHLDLKPSNVLVEDRSASRIKIADWGISRLSSDRQINLPRYDKISKDLLDQRTAYSAGTPLFMSPERFSGDWSLSPTVDIYSLGLMAIQLNTGTLPFRSKLVDPLEEIVTGSLLNNAHLVLVNRSDRFRHFCLSCIHPDPARRPNDYRDIATELKRISKKG